MAPRVSSCAKRGSGTLQALPAVPRGNLPGQEVDLGGQRGEQRQACLSRTWGDRWRPCVSREPAWVGPDP